MAVSFGVRMTYGIWLAPASADLGWGIDTLSFAMAIQSLVWGVATPFAGAVADRWGAGRVVVFAGITYALGLLIMADATTPFEAILGVGVLTGVAMGCSMAPIILSVIAKVVHDEKKRGLYAGIASAGGYSGQVIFVPIAQKVMDLTDWVSMLVVLSGMAALMIPLAVGLMTARPEAAPGPAQPQSLRGALAQAFTHRGYMLVAGGYIVCGFQTLFVGTHFPIMLREYDVSPEMGAWSIALIGLFNIFGCLLWGALGGRRRKKYLLTWLYLLRSVVMAAFVLLPVSNASVAIFASVIGLLWLGTVPLTGGLIAEIFGVRHMATLFGFAFFVHQLGSFFGIWAGGWLFETTGSYMVIWWVSVALGVVAAAFYLPVDDRPVQQAEARPVGSAA